MLVQPAGSVSAWTSSSTVRRIRLIPAAVIAGSVLEQRLEDLSSKNLIHVTQNGKFKKAETLNTELAAKSVYSKLDQKNVTSWLGLRNEAPRGNYTNYTSEQVRRMVAAIRDFLVR